MEPLDVYVLGAGASAAHGAPLTWQILPYALTEPAVRRRPEARSYLRVLRGFLKDLFRFDPDAPGVAPNDYPSLVDVLSLVDMALDRKEDLASGYGHDRLRRVRKALDYAIFAALEDALSFGAAQRPWPWPSQPSAPPAATAPVSARAVRRVPRGHPPESGAGRRPRSSATEDLVARLDPARAVVISFNYDVIVDIALARPGDGGGTIREEPHDAERLPLIGPLLVDYGVEFANAPPQIASLDRDGSVSTAPPRATRFRLYKLHGSFNWLWSRTTGAVYFAGYRKAIGSLFRGPADLVRAGLLPADKVRMDLDRHYRRPDRPADRIGASRPPRGQGEAIDDLESMLVTPTHLKDMRNVHLALLWRRAEEALRRAARITFIGYSLPGDDVHIKYLFGRALATRPRGADPARVLVVDPNEGVQRAYRQFFGPDVEGYSCGFEHFVRHHHSPLPAARGAAGRGRR